MVMEHGQITQIGTHAQLMEQDGHYREIAESSCSATRRFPTNPADAPSHMKRVQSVADIDAAVAAVEKNG